MPRRRTLAALEVRELTAGSFLADAPLVAVSARTGEGLDALRAALDAPPRGCRFVETGRRGCRSIASSRCAASARS